MNNVSSFFAIYRSEDIDSCLPLSQLLVQRPLTLYYRWITETTRFPYTLSLCFEIQKAGPNEDRNLNSKLFRVFPRHAEYIWQAVL